MRLLGQSAADIFPVRKGTQWIYRGEVAWQDERSNAKVRKAAIERIMEIVDVTERRSLKIALVIGHPEDLTWYTPRSPRGCNILIVRDNRAVYLQPCDDSMSRQKLSVSDDQIRRFGQDANMIFRLPLKLMDTFAGDPARHDGMYSWVVDRIRPNVRLTSAGASPGPKTEYDLVYRTLPDHTIATYVPGIGLTAYQYSHHGTVSEVRVRLAEFRPGRK